MSHEPRIQMRTAQRYAGIRMRVTMDSLPGAAPWTRNESSTSRT